MIRSSDLQNGQLVQLNTSNIVEALTSGDLLGVAENCRTINQQDTPESPIQTLEICEVVIDGPCQATLSGSAPAAGGMIYASGDKISITPNGDRIGRIIPRGWSDLTAFADGESVTILINGVR